MSSCLSGGTGRTYGINLETIVKSSSSSSLSSATSSRTSNSSSPSSTLSESSNSTMAVIAVTTRKPRTPRKRPNQTYNEAANLLSTACPTIFSTDKPTSKQPKSPNQHSCFFNEPPEFLPPFRATERPIKTKQREIDTNRSSNQSPNSSSLKQSNAYQHDFETESILDEEIAKGIDIIIGKSNSITGSDELSGENPCFSSESDFNFNFNYNYNYSNTCYGYPVKLGFGGNLEINYGFGLKNGVRALRNVDERNWSFPAINVMNISPIEKKKKKVEKLLKSESEYSIVGDESLLKLKLNYDGVLKAWSEKGSPVPEGISGAESPGSDVNDEANDINYLFRRRKDKIKADTRVGRASIPSTRAVQSTPRSTLARCSFGICSKNACSNFCSVVNEPIGSDRFVNEPCTSKGPLSSIWLE